MIASNLDNNRAVTGAPASPVLVGLHIPKTGGTSFQRHVDRLGPDVAVHYSVVRNAHRVLRGEPLLVEWPEADRARVRSAFGHQMSLEEAFVLPVDRLLMFTILRDPFDFFISSYKQYRRQVHARQMSPSEFFASQKDNGQARRVRARFGRLSDHQSELSLEFVADVLSRLDAVLLTERLDEEIPSLCRLIGLGERAARERVYPETVELDGVTREDVERRDHIDLALVEMARSRSGPDFGNAFGQRKEGWLQVLSRLRDQLDDPVKVAYFSAFRQLEDNHALRGLVEIIEHRKEKQPTQRLLQAFLGSRYDTLLAREPTDREQIQYIKALRQNRRKKEAIALCEELVERAPQDTAALMTLAELVGRKNPARARELVRSVLELNPDHLPARARLRELNDAD